MKPVWKGAISLGLVSIPIILYPAIRREELRFRLLRASDLSPVNYKRVAEADGKEVPWSEIVKGYEYEKGRFVVLKEEDFKRVDVEATETVDILNFVELAGVDPLLFYKPYFMEVGKGGDKAYALLREALAKSGKIGIAKVVIKVRQHLAAIKAQQNGLMLELMHFPDEILKLSEFKIPVVRNVSKAELGMAGQLIEGMSCAWKPELYRDNHEEALHKLVEKKMAGGGRLPHAPKRSRPPSKVIDLVAVLQESLKQSKAGAARGRKPGPKHRAQAA